MIAALLLSLAAPVSAPAAGPPLDENRFVRLFLYRLQYFHRTAAQQDCRRAHPERTRAMDERYAALERRAVALLGPAARDTDTERRRGGYDEDCRRGIILNGYELALHDLELRLAEVER